MIIDTHTHVAIRSLLSPEVPAIERNMPVLPVENLIANMERCNVSRAVLVQWGCSWDHHYLAQCLKDHPTRFAAVAHVDVRRSDATQRLRSLITQHGFRGVRYEATDRSPGINGMAMWEQAHEMGALISASGSSAQAFADGLEPVLQHLPDLMLRIEHLARCSYMNPMPDAQFDRVMRLSRYRSVFINIDGFLQHDYPDHRKYSVYPFGKYMPFVKQAISTFGSERCMWGSEFPFLNNPYEIGIRLLHDACDFLRDSDRRKILGLTASRFWRFELT